MSRLLAILAVCVLAFLVVPRPVKVTLPEALVDAAASEPVNLPKGNLETELTDPFIHRCCLPEFDRLDQAALEEIITFDPLGPPPCTTPFGDDKPDEPPAPTPATAFPGRFGELRRKLMEDGGASDK